MTTQEATARGGMVRCGVCGVAFNALDALVHVDVLPAAALLPAPAQPPGIESPDANASEPAAALDVEPLPDPSAARAETPDLTPKQAAQPLEDADRGELVIEIAEEHARPQPGIHDPAELAVPADVAIDAAIDATPEDAVSEEFAKPLFEAVSLDATQADTIPAVEAAQQADVADSIGPATTATDALLLSPRSKSDEAGSQPQHRALFGGLCALAVVALVLQALYVWRGSIAAQWPAARPVLAQGCAWLGCRIEWPIDLNALSIESSELQAVPQTPNTYGFSTLLRNRGSGPLRYPALELTLTDALDQVVLRRVLLPEQYLNAVQRRQIGNGIASNGELPVRISFEVPGPAIAGYRVGLFYP